MKPSKARVAAHLGMTEGDIFQIAERGDQVVVILSDYRKMVFPVAALKDAPQPVEPAPGENAPLPVTASGKVLPRK